MFRTADGEREERGFEMLHVCPPQRSPAFLRHSPLAGDAGWVTVDRHSLRHTRYGNVFALGDCIDAPNAKTAAAVSQQFPVVVDGLLVAMAGREPERYFDGYGSCPLTVSHDKVEQAMDCTAGTPILPAHSSPVRRIAADRARRFAEHGAAPLTRA